MPSSRRRSTRSSCASRACRPPTPSRHIFTTDPEERAGHTYGKSFRGSTSAPSSGGGTGHPTSWSVPHGRSRRHRRPRLRGCGGGARSIPFGGGSSVVGGVERGFDDGADGVISVDLGRLDGVLEIDPGSRAARDPGRRLRPLAGGPAPAARAHAAALPAEFEFSTLGGWLATRARRPLRHPPHAHRRLRRVPAGGHPRGSSATSGLPGSGAGPSPTGLFLGSEGTLGVITEAWMRLQERPSRVGHAAVQDLRSAARGPRGAIAQSGLAPTNCRLLDPPEAMPHRRRRRRGASCSSASSRPTIRSTPVRAARATRDAGLRRAASSDDATRDGPHGHAGPRGTKRQLAEHLPARALHA